MIDIISKMEKFPELPEIAYVILEEAVKDNCNYNKLAKYVEGSPSLMVKLLKVVNSPFYGFNGKVTNLSQAIGLIGLKNLRNIALAIFILDTLTSLNKNSKNYIVKWEFVIVSSVASKIISKKEEMFVATIVAFMPLYLQGILFDDDTPLDDEVYSQYLDIISNKWHLPEQTIIPVREYYQYRLNGHSETKKINYIAIAEQIANMILLKGLKSEDIKALKQSLKISDHEFVDIIEIIDKHYEEFIKMFNINAEPLNYKNLITLLSEANYKINKLLVQNSILIDKYKTSNLMFSTIFQEIPLAVLLFEDDQLLLTNEKLDNIFKDKIDKISDILDDELCTALKKTRSVSLVTQLKNSVNVEMTYVRVVDSKKKELIFLKDLTEDYRLKEQYKSLGENYAYIINSASIGICIVGTDNNVIFVNQKFCTIFGKTADSFKGKKISEVLCINKECFAKMTLIMNALMRGEIVEKRIEIVSQDKDSNIIYIEVSVTLYKSSDKINGFQFIVNDITERKLLEKKNQELQDEFIKFEKDKIAMELAGATAHEINQPLTSLLLSVEMLKEKNMNESGNLLEKVEKSADRIANIVKKLSDITRYSTRDYAGQHKILDIKDNNRD